MRFLLIFLLIIPTYAFSQSSYDNSDPGIEINIEWNCSQPQFDGILQLPETQQVKIKFSKSDFGTFVKMKPNVFKFKRRELKKNTGAMGIDYKNCVDDFKKNVETALTNKKYKKPNVRNLSCKSSLCKESVGKLWEKVHKSIGKSKYLEINNNKKLIPLSTKLFSENASYKNKDELLGVMKDFCEYDKSPELEKITSVKFLLQLEEIKDDISTKYEKECLDLTKIFVKNEVSKLIETHCLGEIRNQNYCNKLKSFNFYESKFEKILNDRENVKKAYEQKLIKSEINIPHKSIADEVAKESIKKFLKTGDCVFVNQPRNHPDIGNYSTIQIEPMLSELITNHPDKLKKCAKNLLKAKVESLARNPIEITPKLQKYCDTYGEKICEEIRDYAVQAEINVDSLLVLAFGEAAKKLVCSNQLELNEDTNILNFENQMKEIIQCSDMKEGDFKKVETGEFMYSYEGDKSGELDEQGSPTDFPMNYTLKKIGSKYDVYIDYNFLNNKNSKVSPDKMRTRVDNCFKENTSLLKGPDGKFLNLTLMNDDLKMSIPKEMQPLTYNISIADEGFRSNMRKYESDINCEEIVHETLHLLGLCDEYEEKRKGVWVNLNTNRDYDEEKFTQTTAKEKGLVKRIAYNCRASIKDPNSVMNDQQKAFKDARTNKVTCECKSAECNQYLKGDNKFTQSIEDAKDYKGCLNWKDEKIIEVVDEKKYTSETVKGNSSYSYFVKAKNPNGVLFPAHFERIIYGTCKSKAVKFSTCSRWAYVTGNCKNRPKYCEDPKEWLGY